MKNPSLLILTPALILAVFLSGCANTPTAIPETIPPPTDTVIPTITTLATLDPCGPETIRAEVDKVHRHMREFDDASTLAASMPREQLSAPIANLQKIRREAEDEVVASCLATLKDFQIKHMNSVITTLIAFLSLNDPLALDCTSEEKSADEEVICQSIIDAREQHDQYTVELARILEIPIITATPEVNPAQTPTP